MIAPIIAGQVRPARRPPNNCKAAKATCPARGGRCLSDQVKVDVRKPKRLAGTGKTVLSQMFGAGERNRRSMGTVLQLLLLVRPDEEECDILATFEVVYRKATNFDCSHHRLLLVRFPTLGATWRFRNAQIEL
jgi:hypothetical protein